MEEEVNLELVPMEEDQKPDTSEWSAYQVTKNKENIKRVEDGSKISKRSNKERKVKPGKQPKVPDEKLSEKEGVMNWLYSFLVVGRPVTIKTAVIN